MYEIETFGPIRSGTLLSRFAKGNNGSDSQPSSREPMAERREAFPLRTKITKRSQTMQQNQRFLKMHFVRTTPH
jgi:hypothetical protein